jgi:hypothetical protein
MAMPSYRPLADLGPPGKDAGVRTVQGHGLAARTPHRNAQLPALADLGPPGKDAGVRTVHGHGLAARTPHGDAQIRQEVVKMAW